MPVDEPTPWPAALDLADEAGHEAHQRPLLEPEPADEPDSLSLPSRRPAPDAALVPALLALTLAGLGLALSQLTYGRIAVVLFGGLSVLAGGHALLAAKQKYLVPGLGAGAGVFALFLGLVLPSWLGLYDWWPTRDDGDAKQTKVMPFDGGAPQPMEWVDASRMFWQRGDVRVSLTGAGVHPVELKGPKGEKQPSRDALLVLRLRVANVGVARKIDFHSWTAAPTAQIPAPRLTDSAGRALAVKTFEAGWEPAGRIAGAGIFPGKFAEDLLIFEAPARGLEYLRLELPAAAFGDSETIKMQIPTSTFGGSGEPRAGLK